VQAQLSVCSLALAACQSDLARELVELATKDPALWTLVALVAMSAILWCWRMCWYLSGYQSAFPPDRSVTI
jgi:hypothetical protein